MVHYYTLTTLGKARRLRTLVLEALKSYPIRVLGVRLLSNEQNGIFRIDAEDGRYVMRVARADNGHSLLHIESEMRFLAAVRESGVPALAPVAATDGRLALTVAVPGVPEPRHCGLFTWVPGREIGDRATPDRWESLGDLSARLHDVGAAFRPPSTFEVTENDSPFPFDEECVFFEDQYAQLFASGDLNEIRRAIERVQKDIDVLRERGPLIITHGDLHGWNVLESRGHLHPIDFEDLLMQHPIQDVAITLYYNWGDEGSEALFQAFRHGYERVRVWPEEYPGQLELHMLARSLNLVNYVLYSEEDDPADYPELIPRLMSRIRLLRERGVL